MPPIGIATFVFIAVVESDPPLGDAALFVDLPHEYE
jgi:hypothetical protein